jgi:hypothetical protein
MDGRMKRYAWLFVLVAGLVVPMTAAGSGFSLAVGVSPQLGAAYAGAWDPGYSGTAIEILGQGTIANFPVEAGIEAGASPIGWQILLPLRAGIRFGESSVVSGICLLEAAPGLSLTRPALFMLGLGGFARIEWNPSAGFGLYASAGVQLTLCPAYQDFTSFNYQSLDVPLSVGVRWLLAR